MLPLEPIAPPEDFSIPPGLEEVGRYASGHEAAEHGLVVLAMRLGYWTIETPRGHHLLVDAAEAGDVRAQLTLFDHESAGWPPRPRPVPRLRFRWAAPLAWACVLVAVFRIQVLRPGVLEEGGALDAGALFERGEWWRPVTALFLHADLGHLVANLASGFFMMGLVLGVTGLGRGAFQLATAAIAGNLGAAMLHPRHGYTSLGASTVVFAALGLLTGGAIRTALADGPPARLRALLLPALAGVSLLALYGSGGLQTDVIAHGTGFAAGVVTGLVHGASRPAGVG